MPDITHLGKEVFKDGAHYADAVSVEAAAEIVAAMQRPASIIAMIERESAKRGRYEKRLGDVLVDAIRNRFDVEDGNG